MFNLWILYVFQVPYVIFPLNAHLRNPKYHLMPQDSKARVVFSLTVLRFFEKKNILYPKSWKSFTEKKITIIAIAQ